MADPDEFEEDLQTRVFRIEDVMARQAARRYGGPVLEAEKVLRGAESEARFVMDLPPSAREPDMERMALAILDALECLKEALKKTGGAEPRT